MDSVEEEYNQQYLDQNEVMRDAYEKND